MRINYACKLLRHIGLTVLLAGWLTTATAAPPIPSAVPSFNRSRPPQTVEEALTRGDGLRDELIKAVFETRNWKTAQYRYEEAKKYYSFILDELEPHNAYAAMNLGFMPMVLYRIAPSNEKEILYNVARAKLTLADEKRKGYADAHRYLGELHALRGEWADAITKFARIKGSRAEDAHVHAWWGYCLLKQGDKEGARSHFRLALERGIPEDCVTWAKRHL